jgi:hypothetical protein
VEFLVEAARDHVTDQFFEPFAFAFGSGGAPITSAVGKRHRRPLSETDYEIREAGKRDCDGRSVVGNWR